jgi:hypothetical protein
MTATKKRTQQQKFRQFYLKLLCQYCLSISQNWSVCDITISLKTQIVNLGSGMALCENEGIAAIYKQLVGKAEAVMSTITSTIHCLPLLPSSGTLSGCLNSCNLTNTDPSMLFFHHDITAPSWPQPTHYRRFTITFRHTTLGWTLLEGWSGRLRDLYLTKHNFHKRQTSMPAAEFEPAVPASKRQQTYTSDRAATWTGHYTLITLYK